MMGDDPPMGPRALWAPWRLAYLEEVGAREKSCGPPDDSSGSFLRDAWLDPSGDESNHVVVRGRAGLIMLNRYPYANGHLLVALGEARPTLLDYDESQRAELWRLTDCAVDLMQRALEPQGINMGVNQGRCAGAGVPQHLHVHLVPRWSGDVNFMSVVGQVRVIPGALEEMAGRYRRMWATMRTEWAGI
jgi:ATP adenylyltransferase